jgi:signal peptidase II
MKKSVIVTLVILLVLVLDQWLKIWVKLNMPYGSSDPILGLSWAQLHFVENNGMAFGLSYGGVVGKFVLSTFRIAMVGVLIYILRALIKSKESLSLLISFSLIIAGAMGNIIDSMFYGLIFSESVYHSGSLAEFMPEGGGYAPFLQGRVVDMFSFPLFSGTYPDWIPFVGGTDFTFFSFIFNVADAAISVGVASIILFHRSFFKHDKSEKAASESSNSSVITPPIAAEEE